MAAALIHCRTRPIPPVASEEIWIGVADIHRADPETDPSTGDGYVRITPSDPGRPSFGILPLSGPIDPFTVIVWWLQVCNVVGVTDGGFS